MNDMPQAVRSTLLLYADDSCILYKEVDEIEKQLNKDFENICDWFVDNKLSIHFGEDKTKSILWFVDNKLSIHSDEDKTKSILWFVDNKLSMHFGEDKTRSILFSSK